jgi:3-oxoadipate enol-lactonase
MADDIAAVMNHHGIAAAHVLGISMGGCIALMLALRHPHKVRSQVVAVSLAWGPHPSRSSFMLETGRLLRDSGFPRHVINRYNAILTLGQEVFQYESFIDLWINAPPDPYEQTRAGYELQRDAIRQYDVRAQLSSITTPTLVMSSPDDILVPPYLQDEIADGIPGAQIKRYPGGHVFMALPLYSAAFIQDVIAFWEQHS